MNHALAITRHLSSSELEFLLATDVPIRLATIGPDGYPRITPLWFAWDGVAFHMTSLAGKPHVMDLRRDPRAAVCLDIEAAKSVHSVRSNWRLTTKSVVKLFDDEDGVWTERITRKYCGDDPCIEDVVSMRTSARRVVMELLPERLLGVGTFPTQGSR